MYVNDSKGCQILIREPAFSFNWKKSDPIGILDFFFFSTYLHHIGESGRFQGHRQPWNHHDSCCK